MLKKVCVKNILLLEYLCMCSNERSSSTFQVNLEEAIQITVVFIVPYHRKGK